MSQIKAQSVWVKGASNAKSSEWSARLEKCYIMSISVQRDSATVLQCYSVTVLQCYSELKGIRKAEMRGTVCKLSPMKEECSFFALMSCNVVILKSSWPLLSSTSVTCF